MIVGATGAVGGFCVEELLRSPLYSKVVTLSRSPVPLDHPKLEKHQIDFDRLEEYAHLTAVDDIFCSLGTIAQKTVSREAYRKVDVDYPAKIAELSLKKGARRYFLVTAVQANPDSRFYYLKFKGEVERKVSSFPFEAVHIFRPALIVGPRKEFRVNETLAILISRVFPFLFAGPFANFKPIEAAAIARAMLRSAETDARGTIIHESREIRDIGRVINKLD